jgi:arabinogalactan oligomer/maltooligosaccharide transport system substrate-binding protein
MKKSLWAVLPMAALLVSNLVGCNNGEPTKPQIRIGVDSDTWIEALQHYFDEHPVSQDFTVKVENSGAAGAADKITTDHESMPDIQLVIDGEVTRNFDSLATLTATTLTNIAENAPEVYVNGAKVGNVVKYAPVTYDGMAFAWNENMLTAMGIDLTDADEDGLPDAIDTFEEIFAITKGWKEHPETRPTYTNKKGDKIVIDTFFPMSLTNAWSDYSSLTAEGWQLYASGNPLEPGFEDPKFAAGLGFIAAAADNYLSTIKDENGVYNLRKGDDMGWRWDDFLNNEVAPTGLVGTWHDVAKAETDLGVNYHFSKMPTWKGNQLTPFVKTKGFVINGYSKNLAAAKLVFEKLYSEEALNIMVNNSSYLPSLKENAKFKVTLPNENSTEMSAAFLGNYPEPQFTLPANPSVKAMDAVWYYSNNGICVTLKKAWDEAAANTGAERSTWLESLAAGHKALADQGLAEKNVAPQ